LNPATLLYPLHQGSFDAGLLLAAAGTALAVRGHRGRTARPATGLIVAGVALATLLSTGNAPALIVPALALLTAGGAGAASLRRHLPQPASEDRPGRLVRPICLAAPLLPGAVLLAWFPAHAYPPPIPHVVWVRLATMAVVLGGSLALWSFDRRWGRLSPGLLAISTAGIFATVPDTQQAVALMGVAGGVAIMAWRPRLRLGQVAIPPLLGLVAWTVAVGGRGRHSAIVGGLACLGLLVIEPLVHLLAPATEGSPRKDTSRRALPPRVVLAALGGQLLVVGLESRVVGLSATTLRALVIGLPILAATAAVLLSWQRAALHWVQDLAGARVASPPPRRLSRSAERL
jgi:hypothetical protein